MVLRLLIVRGLIAASILLGWGIACQQTPATPGLNIEATVAAAVKAALPEPTPKATPDIDATVEARLQAILKAIPTPTPTLVPPTPTPTPTPVPPTPTPVPPTPTPTLNSIVERVRPSVVRIETDDGSGSGFIIQVGFPTAQESNTALVLTNNHVIEGAKWIDVNVNDRLVIRAEVWGVDLGNDIALLRICCGDFQALEMAKDAEVAVGNQAIAMGYPLGIPGRASITNGIVSAIRYENNQWVIQTDAAINPGNSGGPLISSDGKVLGVNTRKEFFSGDGRAVEGLAFAVSHRTVNEILDGLKSGYMKPVALGDRVTYGGNSVYFLPPVTKSKADQYLASLIRRGVTIWEKSKKWQLRQVDGVYEIRFGLYIELELRYKTEVELQEWLEDYKRDFELQEAFVGAVCARQEEDFDDVPTVGVIVDLSTLQFDSVIQRMPCIK